MGPRTKIAIVLLLTGAVWMAVLLRLGIWHATVTPADGHLSRTFNGWAAYPPSRHLFLLQSEPDDFANGKAYTSGTYLYIFLTFIYLAPFHFLLGLPYEVAHNFLVYSYVFCLALILIVTTRKQLVAIAESGNILVWLLVFISIGITITDPLPWTSSFNANRDNSFILVAGAFCYLSTFIFRNQIPRLPLLIVGIFLASWSPIYVPAWILATLFFRPTLKLDLRWIAEVAGVSLLALISAELPVLVCRLAGIEPIGSSVMFRSGLDGSTQYMSSIFQAAYAPADPRHWPTGWYVLVTAVLCLCFAYVFRGQNYRPVQQAIFLLIPYCTTVIFLPQMTSIHPYLTDVFIFIPATFLISFWSLQKPFWEKLGGNTYVVALIAAGLILMTNLLAVAQMPRFGFVERDIMPFASLIVFGSIAVYVVLKLVKRFRQTEIKS